MSIDVLDLPHSTNSRESWVYVHYDADGRVLYIGCSSYLRARHGQHRSSSPWFADIADMSIAGPFNDRQAALDYEARLIREHQPPNNVMHTDRAVHVYHPPKPPTPIKQAEEDVRQARRALLRAERALFVARRDNLKT